MKRTARIERATSESSVLVELDLDGTGRTEISTTVPFYDHMLTALGKHSLIDLTVRATGDTHIDAHHTVEDVAICLGEALRAALGDRSVSRVQDKVATLVDPAGLTEKSGQGVQVTLDDASFEARAAYEGNPNDLVVHQQDIQAVVNALWAGGATAVTVAGQRIVSTTGIKCEGPVVQLQGVPYPQPYVIEAVGDPVALTAALDSDPLVTGYRSDAANPYIRIGWDMNVESRVEAPAYDGLLDVRYATPIGSGTS